jgi:hypothetical protein
LPSVMDGTEPIDARAGADLLVDVQLSWMDEPVRVSIWGKDGRLPSA